MSNKWCSPTIIDGTAWGAGYAVNAQASTLGLNPVPSIPPQLSVDGQAVDGTCVPYQRAAHCQITVHCAQAGRASAQPASEQRHHHGQGIRLPRVSYGKR